MTNDLPAAPAPYRGRFAPSPTGVLHFGSLVAALGSWLRARACGGTWLVRMEDLDPPREVAGSAQAILTTLDAFGLRSDEPVMFQSRRGDAYDVALAHLRDIGLAFECRCSRRELALRNGTSASGEPGGEAIHRGACVVSAANAQRAPAWRLRVPDATIAFADALQGQRQQSLRDAAGDFVLRRADGYWAYQLAVVIDDAAQRISEVVRGADLLDSTPRQIHLQAVLGLPTPAYLHLPLAVDAAGAKLSKQSASAPVDAADPMPALRHALRFLGSRAADDTATTVDALLARAVRAFELSHLPRQRSIALA